MEDPNRDFLCVVHSFDENFQYDNYQDDQEEFVYEPKILNLI